MKNLFKRLITILMFTMIFYNHTYVSAEECINFYLASDQSEVCKNEELTLVLSAKSVSFINISTFKVSLNFEKDAIQFKEASPIIPIGEYELKTNVNEGVVETIFLTENEGINFQDTINLIEFNFKTTRNSAGKVAKVTGKIEGVGNYDEKYLSAKFDGEFSVEIQDSPKIDCRLSLLSSKEGQLAPLFDKDVFDYTMDVSKDTKYIQFEFVPIECGVTVKQNRKKLKKPGEETLIKIIVSSQDKKNKNVYRVNIRRDVQGDGVGKRGKGRKSLGDENGAKILDEKTINFGKPFKGAKNLVLRESGFNFLIFIFTIFVVVLTMYIVWKERKGTEEEDSFESDM